MTRFREQKKFKIASTIEQTPFESPAVQSFFTKWCEINDSIQPQTISRKEWEQKGLQSKLEKRPNGKLTLYIPSDLQLWEMIGIVELIDRDTFAKKPEQKDLAKKKLFELGKTFRNAGIYIAQRLDFIPQGQEIAQALAEEFYEYGRFLTSEKIAGDSKNIAAIASHVLTDQEIAETDRFLAGDSLYQSRLAKTEKTPKPNSIESAETDHDKPDDFLEKIEKERQKTLAQFFRISEKAFILQKKTEIKKTKNNDIDLTPWINNSPIHSTFISKVEKAMIQKIEEPKRELHAAIFRRGLEKLLNEMRETTSHGWRAAINSFFETLGINLRAENETLIDSLQINRLKEELTVIRQTNDTVRISEKEREIADKIQLAVSSFRYQLEANNPSEMVVNQYINCVGASMLGGALMREAGLNYLVGALPEHSILFLITDDGHFEWLDMLSISHSQDVSNELITGFNKNGSKLTIADIIKFAENPVSQELKFQINDDNFKNKLEWLDKKLKLYITVFKPEHGEQLQVLHNTGITLHDLRRHEEAVEAFRQAIAVDPEYSESYRGLGRELFDLGRNEEAITTYRQAITIDSERAPAYVDLGIALEKLARHTEAIAVYRQAIAIDPEYPIAYIRLGLLLSHLGRDKEVNEALQKFIELADPQKYAYWIKHAKEKIAKLHNQTRHSN